MLKKLMKYEFRVLCPWYGIAFALCLILGMLTRFAIVGLQAYGNVETNDFFNNFGVALTAMAVPTATMTLIIVLVATGLLCVVLPAWSFYKNYLKDEGYLMFTLPVTVKQLFFSKFNMALIGSYAFAIVAVLSLLIAFLGVGEAGDVGGSLAPLAPTGGELVMSVISFILFILSAILTPVVTFGTIYTSFMIGQRANKNRFVWSVIAYIAITSIAQTVTQIGQFLITICFPEYADPTVLMLITAICTFLYTVGMGLATVLYPIHAMENHLNLE